MGGAVKGFVTGLERRKGVNVFLEAVFRVIDGGLKMLFSLGGG